MTNEQRIEEAFYGVDFSEKEEVLRASKDLNGIPGTEVISWLTKSSKNWHYCELLYGIRNIEEIFGAKFSLKKLVELYFEEPDLWFNSDNSEMFKEFKQLTGRDISVDDIVELIDMDFIRESITFDIGIFGFIEFIDENGGDTKAFVKRVISIADELSQSEILDIASPADYIDVDNADAEKLFQCIKWDEIEKNYSCMKDELVAFFEKFAPNLALQIA